MIQWFALEVNALKYPSLAASPFASADSLKAGPCAGTPPGITNSHFPDLQHCSQLVLLSPCSPSSACIFTAAPVSPVCALSYIKAYQGVMLMSRAEQEMYFLFLGKILAFNLNAVFVQKCPCETI